MPWVRLDDRFWSNRKVRAAGESIHVYVLALSWVGDELTNGHIPTHELAFICAGIKNPIRHAERCVDGGLLERTDDGYFIPDFLEYNDSREAVLAKRDADRKRKRRHRDAKRSPEGVTPDSERTPQGIQPASARPDPTRPDPTQNHQPPPSTANPKNASRNGAGGGVVETVEQAIDAIARNRSGIDPAKLTKHANAAVNAGHHPARLVTHTLDDWPRSVGNPTGFAITRLTDLAKETP